VTSKPGHPEDEWHPSEVSREESDALGVVVEAHDEGCCVLNGALRVKRAVDVVEFDSAGHAIDNELIRFRELEVDEVARRAAVDERVGSDRGACVEAFELHFDFKRVLTSGGAKN
jgi:uncharacterized protein YbaA (DUF1428 family)